MCWLILYLNINFSTMHRYSFICGESFSTFMFYLIALCPHLSREDEITSEYCIYCECCWNFDTNKHPCNGFSFKYFLSTLWVLLHYKIYRCADISWYVIGEFLRRCLCSVVLLDDFIDLKMKQWHRIYFEMWQDFWNAVHTKY